MCVADSSSITPTLEETSGRQIAVIPNNQRWEVSGEIEEIERKWSPFPNSCKSIQSSWGKITAKSPQGTHLSILTTKHIAKHIAKHIPRCGSVAKHN